MILWVLRSGPKCLGRRRLPAMWEVQTARIMRVSKEKLAPFHSFVFTQLFLGLRWETCRAAHRAIFSSTCEQPWWGGSGPFWFLFNLYLNELHHHSLLPLNGDGMCADFSARHGFESRPCHLLTGETWANFSSWSVKPRFLWKSKYTERVLSRVSKI